MISGPVGQRGDEVSVARFVADQRTMHRVPHTVTCAILGISISWFYKWSVAGPPSGSVAAPSWTRGCASCSGRPSAATVRPVSTPGLTRKDRSAPKFPDLLHRDFTAAAPNVKWCGDISEIPTDEGKLYFASVLDLHSRRLLASATSDHPDADLACDAIKMAAAVRGGRAAIDGVIFHTDYAEVCVKPRICGDGLHLWGYRWISRLSVSGLSQAVEGLELVFGERLGGRGVDGGGGGVDRLPHHVQGGKGVERCCGGSVFVAEEAHDDR